MIDGVDVDSGEWHGKTVVNEIGVIVFVKTEGSWKKQWCQVYHYKPECQTNDIQKLFGVQGMKFINHNIVRKILRYYD